MAKHMVICKECGKQFDANQKGTLRNRQTGRYTCPSCAKRVMSIQKNNINISKAAARGMKQSYLVMGIKIFIGIIFFIGTVQQKDIWGWIIGIACTGAMLAWGIVPFVKRKKKSPVSWTGGNLDEHIAKLKEMNEHDKAMYIVSQDAEKLDADGKTDEAIPLYETVVQSKSIYPRVYDRLAAIYHEKGLYTDEIRVLSTYLDIAAGYNWESYKIDPYKQRLEIARSLII
jgi:DNA-directed RNA polymerase subunit RPC12/RpoP